MASGQWAVVLRHVQRLFQGGSVSGLTEGQLLDRFFASRDDVAFGAIVARHGPMVLGVCRGVLNDPHDVEDAFQATFLVLVRKASGLRDRDLLGPWLYGVARRVALRARADARKRKARERPEIEAESAPVATFDAELRELQTLVREEVDRLPANDRMAVVYCYLEGMTHEEAADRLGWPVGTVKGRLSRARDKLRDRLNRRGVALPAVLAANSAGKFPTIVPPPLIASTTLAATRLAAGQILTAGIVSAHALSLMEGVIGTMFQTKLKLTALALVATCGVAVPGVMAYQFGGIGGTEPAAAPQILPPPAQIPIPSVNATADVAASQRAREARVLLAEKALKLINDREATVNAKPEIESIDLWSRRLAEAQGGAGSSREDRLEAYQAHLDRMEEVFQKADKWAKAGQAHPLDTLDARYRRDEAKSLLDEARNRQEVFFGGDGTASGRPLLTIEQTPDDEKRNRAILGMLDKKVAMNFPADTPLEDIKKYIEQATVDEPGGFSSGIPIYVDPGALQDADLTMASTVTINLEGVPLRTTLRLLLHQLGLDYRVDGGLLLISDVTTIAEQEKAKNSKARKQ